MPTSICATLLLNNRKGMTKDHICEQIEWLINEMKIRGASLPHNEVQASSIYRIGTYHLSSCVIKSKEVIEPMVTASTDGEKILLMSYYRNSVIPVFFNESIICVSLHGFGRPAVYEEGVTRQSLWAKTTYIE